jgi:hypothetical protein
MVAEDLMSLGILFQINRPETDGRGFTLAGSVDR